MKTFLHALAIANLNTILLSLPHFNARVSRVILMRIDFTQIEVNFNTLNRRKIFR
jgi:hypothetical protein